MSKNKWLVVVRCIFMIAISCEVGVVAAETTPLKINQALIAKIAAIAPDESNANTLENMLGAPAACLPTTTQPAETWVCQWKADTSSHRLQNTLNVTFEAGMIAQVVGIDANGKYLVVTH